MLRLFRNIINLREAIPFVCKQRIPAINMSVEFADDSAKRKSDELLDEDVLIKKPKILNQENIHEDVEAIIANTNKYRKPKKAVLLLSYLGKEYYGMQRNHDVSTVEEELLKALLQAGVILQNEFDFPKTMKFQRAARTDKGVSAVRQIVSLKIPVNEISSELPRKINDLLPPEIRLIAAKRVIQSFDAKVRCDARTYSYMLPTFAFSPDCENDEEYRISSDRIEQVNAFLKNYIGTHNFFNFTSGRLAGDPSCKRYIIDCECGPPFLSHGLEFSVIKVKGQSFMLHQIRKMVGLAIAYMRKFADDEVLKKTWLNERIDIPKAPGLGLMLEELHYDWYNKKYGSDGMHDPLIWDEYDDLVNQFKMEKICSNIATTEREEKSMMQWLESLPKHTYDVREDGPPSGVPEMQSVGDKCGDSEGRESGSGTKSSELLCDKPDSRTENSCEGGELISQTEQTAAVSSRTEDESASLRVDTSSPCEEKGI